MSTFQQSLVTGAQNQWVEKSDASILKSSADFYPKVVDLQKRIGAGGFAIVATSRAMNNVSPLKVIMSNSSFSRDEHSNDILKIAGALLAAHVRKSPHPVYWNSENAQQNTPKIPSPARELKFENAKIGGLAFPVYLGGKQSGMAIFFSPSIDVTREMQMDIHRKSYVLLRELFRIELSSKSDISAINIREAECLQFAGNGMTSDDIAEHLKLSVHTINAHLSSATAKLDSVNRIQAIAKAIRLGLIN